MITVKYLAVTTYRLLEHPVFYINFIPLITNRPTIKLSCLTRDNPTHMHPAKPPVTVGDKINLSGNQCCLTANIAVHTSSVGAEAFSTLNAELNPICHLLALLGAHHFLHVSTIRVKLLTLRLLMSYIYIWSTYS